MLALALIVAPPSAWAARLRIHEMAESPRYGQKFWGMLGRGLFNAVTSPLDVIVNVVNETKAGPPVVGTMTGVGKGLGCGVLRLGSGAVDVVTSWVPGFNGFPVSDSYENCLGPAGERAAMAPAVPDTGEAESESSWHVPTTEPGAAQASEPAPKKRWSK
jgi:putative exosortase-associated protein (TIGR04073 family)